MVGKDGGTTSSSTSGVTQPTRAFDQMMTASLLQNPQIVAGMTASLHQLAGQHKHGGAGGAGAPTAKRRRIQTSTGQHPLSAVSLVPAGGSGPNANSPLSITLGTACVVRTPT